MSIIWKYIIKQLVITTLTSSLVLCVLVWLAQSLKSIDLIIRYGASFPDLMLLISLLLPDILMIILPLSFFISTLIVLSRLLHDHELVVMCTLGISPFQLFKPFLIMAVFITTMMYSISLYFLPISFQMFRNLQFSLHNQYKISLIHEGEFVHFNNITVYVKAKSMHGQIKGVFIHDNRDPLFPVTFTAASGQILEGTNPSQILLINGTRQAKDKRSMGVNFLSFSSYIHELQKPEQSPSKRQKKPSEHFVWDLLTTHSNTSESEDSARKMRAEAHQRILTPLLPLIFALVSVSTILHAPFNRVHRLSPFAWAATIVIAIQILLLGLLHYGTRHTFYIYAAYALLFSVAMACIHNFHHHRLKSSRVLPK